MSKLRIIAPAEWDFTEALSWYAERSPRAAEGFQSQFEHALEKISSQPVTFPLVDEIHRFYLMDRYPYQVIYRLQDDWITVVAVAHAKREPRYWKDR